MRFLKSIISLAVIVLFAGSAMAVPSGKTVEFDGKGAGKVIFDGKVHADKGNKCNDCHTKIFQMKKGTAKTVRSAIKSDEGPSSPVAAFESRHRRSFLIAIPVFFGTGLYQDDDTQDDKTMTTKKSDQKLIQAFHAPPFARYYSLDIIHPDNS